MTGQQSLWHLRSCFALVRNKPFHNADAQHLMGFWLQGRDDQVRASAEAIATTRPDRQPNWHSTQGEPA